MYVGVVVLWGIALWRITPDHLLFDALLLGGALLATYLVQRETKKMREFAVENPALALMEGADITEFKKFEAQVKGLLITGSSPAVIDPSTPPATNVPKGPEV